MSASLAVHAILMLLALGACLVVAFVCLRQVFRLFAVHAPTSSAPSLVRSTVALRRMDDEDEDDALSPVAPAQHTSHASNVN